MVSKGLLGPKTNADDEFSTRVLRNVKRGGSLEKAKSDLAGKKLERFK